MSNVDTKMSMPESRRQNLPDHILIAIFYITKIELNKSEMHFQIFAKGHVRKVTAVSFSI